MARTEPQKSPLPDDLDALRQRIQDEFPSLSRRLQEVASHILDNSQMIAFGTVAEIAESADVHGSTLVRFARHFGFSGFSEMQRLFKARQIAQSPDYSERIRLIQTDLGNSDALTAPQLLDEFTTANVMSLEHLRNHIDPYDLMRTVELMDSASSIYVCGIRRAFPVSMYLMYALSHMHVRCHAIDGLGCMLFENLQHIKPGDLLIVVTYRPYSDVTLKAVEIAVEKGADIVAITDSDVSPVVADANVSFVIRDAEVRTFRSLNSTMCLAQTLCISLGFKRGTSTTTTDQ